MSAARTASAALQRATPALAASLEERRNDDGELVLVSASGAMSVHPEEEPLVRLIDGARSVEDLVKAGLTCTPPVRAMATLALLRRLQTSGLLTGFSAVEGHLVTGASRRRRRWLDLRVPVPLLGQLLGVGKLLGRGGLRALPWVGLAALLAGLVGSTVAGRLPGLLAPLEGDDLGQEVIAGWIALSMMLSWRGLWRGLSFAALGLPLPRAVVRFTLVVLYGDIDDRDRRSASREQRLRIASTGLSAMALGTGLATLAWLAIDPSDVRLQLLASAALYLTVADASPYGKSDGFHLIGILTGIPDLRRRSASFLLRRSLRNVLRSEPVSPLEQTYLTVASAWLGHALLSLFLLTWHLLPGTLQAVSRAARADLDGLAGVAMALVGVGAAGLVVVLVGGVLVVLGGAVMQLVRRPRSTPPRESQRIGTDAESLTSELSKVPFLAALPDDELAGVVAGMRRERHDEGAAIVTQGEPGDRFCFLHGGEADVIYEEESGLQHRVARLTPGDFFGEIALVEETPRTATVIARSACEVLTLDRETFVALVERSQFAREAILDQVRNAAFLRKVRVFSHLGAGLMGQLLAGIEVVRLPAGHTVVQEGDDGDAMFVIREGRCEVSRTRDEGGDHAIGELRPGDWFGEIAVLRGVERTATVRSLDAATLIRVPAEVLDALLMEDLETGIALEQTVARRLVALEAR